MNFHHFGYEMFFEKFEFKKINLINVESIQGVE